MQHALDDSFADERGLPPRDQALFDAVCANYPAGVKARLDAGVDPDQPRGDGVGRNPLIIAAEAGYYNCMRALLEGGADVHFIGGDYRSPLRVALQRPDETAVRMLLDHGADPYFLAVGKRPDGTPYDGPVTDLAIALEGDPAIAKMVSEAAQKYALCNLLHRTKASEPNDIPAITALLDSGVPVDIRDNNDRTALMYACSDRDAPLVKLLLERGADPEVTMRDGETTALFFACWGAVPPPDAAIVKLLLDHGADPKRVGKSGVSLMHAAATGKDEETLKLLATRGVSLTARNGRGQTPGEAAIEYGHESTEIIPLIERVLEWRRNQVDILAREAAVLNHPLQAMSKLRLRPKNPANR